VFRSGDAGSLTSALQRLHEDGAYAQSLGQQAYERFWCDPPTPANHARELLQGYAGVIARAAARRHAGARAEEAVY